MIRKMCSTELTRSLRFPLLFRAQPATCHLKRAGSVTGPAELGLPRDSQDLRARRLLPKPYVTLKSRICLYRCKDNTNVMKWY